MSKISKAVDRYWKSPSTNIFRNSIDAILGLGVLIILPLVSLVTTILTKASGWAEYAFPIFSICVAGAYDVYGRYVPDSPANIKLYLRLGVDFTAIVLSCVFMNHENALLRLLPSMLLVISGILVLGEVFLRVQTAIMLSEWYSSLGEEG